MFQITCESLSKAFDNRSQNTHHAPVSNLSATFEAGQISAVIGESGCGKTTLLRMLAGLMSPDSGRITYSDDNATATASAPKIAMVFQEPRLFPWLTVEENVALAVRHLPADTQKKRVAETLEIVGLSERSQALVSELSGGMAQRAGFARALVSDPDILLLDEAFSALDALTRDRLRTEFVRIWQKRPMTVVLVTHDVWETVLLSTSVYKLSEGALNKVLEVDAPYPRKLTDERMAEKAGVLMNSFFAPTD